MAMSMQMGARIEQNMSMQLTFSQKLSLEILQLNVQALEQRIAEELEINPLLEIRESSLETVDSPIDSEFSGDDKHSEESIDFGDSLAPEVEQENIDAFQDVFEPILGEGNYQRGSSEDDDLDPLTLLIDHPKDFEAHIKDQLSFLNPADDLREKVEILISLLDDRGYLNMDLEQLVESENLQGELRLWIRALRFIQEELNPPGLGARDLQECLLIQVWRKGRGFTFEANLLERQFDNLLANRLDMMATAMNVSVEKIVDAVEFLKTLNFRPAASFFEAKNQVLRPDAIVLYDGPDLLHPKGRFRIQLSQRGQPELEVIPGTKYKYEGMSRDEKAYITNHTNNAKALIEAVRRRTETLFLVIQSICQRQLAFFEEGQAGLVPLQMQEIAVDLGMSAATITRTVKDKVISTDYGVFELKHFFSMKKVKMGSGEVAERDDLFKALQSVVEQEDRSKPLSDAAISKALAKQGHQVAVRTVSKYREMLSIPSSSKRKQF
jgi:RNA polymerase sigma-54 factor